MQWTDSSANFDMAKSHVRKMFMKTTIVCQQDRWFSRRHDIQRNDTERNDTKRRGLSCDTQLNTLYLVPICW